MSRPDPVTREMPPCKGCKDRTPGCHDNCKRYSEWKTGIEQIKKARKEYEKKMWPRVNRLW